MSTNRKSKFSGLFEPAPTVVDPSTPAAVDDVQTPAAASAEVPLTAPVPERVQEVLPTPARATSRATLQRTTTRGTRSTPAPAPHQERRLGSGKRNNPDYFQATAYIPQQLKEEVDIKLIRAKRQRPELDFSVLMEELLEQWTRDKK